MQIVCTVCGEKFEAESKLAKYCSQACRPTRPKKEKNCQICGERFETIYADTETCSHQCRHKLTTETRRKRHAINFPVLNCKKCEKSFQARANNQVYCSFHCKQRAVAKNQRSNPSNYENVNCVQCGKIFERFKKYKNIRLCSRLCVGIFSTRKEKPTKVIRYRDHLFRWVEDATHHKYGHYRRSEKKKGKNIVFMLHRTVWEDYHGRKIPDGYHIHHKDHNPHNNDISNLECLSPADHARIHFVEGLGSTKVCKKCHGEFEAKNKWVTKCNLCLNLEGA